MPQTVLIGISRIILASVIAGSGFEEGDIKASHTIVATEDRVVGARAYEPTLEAVSTYLPKFEQLGQRLCLITGVPFRRHKAQAEPCCIGTIFKKVWLRTCDLRLCQMGKDCSNRTWSLLRLYFETALHGHRHQRPLGSEKYA